MGRTRRYRRHYRGIKFSVDYIIFTQCPKITATPNDGEVKAIKFATIEEVKEIVSQAKQGKLKVTPWFFLIFEQFLLPWWQTLLRNIEELKTDDKVYHL
jgi:isopentenyldiphosphate isomerase